MIPFKKRILFDTNVIVYLFDSNDEVRQKLAATLTQKIEYIKNGCLSAQCLSEFMNVTTRGIHPILTKEKAYHEVCQFTRTFSIIPINENIIIEAARVTRDHNMAYYDAQIWAAAKLNQIPVIFSEDFQDGQILEGVRFVNPFSEKFELKNWI